MPPIMAQHAMSYSNKFLFLYPSFPSQICCLARLFPIHVHRSIWIAILDLTIVQILMERYFITFCELTAWGWTQKGRMK